MPITGSELNINMLFLSHILMVELGSGDEKKEDGWGSSGESLHTTYINLSSLAAQRSTVRVLPFRSSSVISAPSSRPP